MKTVKTPKAVMTNVAIMFGGDWTPVKRLRKVRKYDTDLAYHIDMNKLMKMSDKEIEAYAKPMYLDIFRRGLEVNEVYCVDISCKPVYKDGIAYYKAVNPFIIIMEAIDNLTDSCVYYEDWKAELKAKAKA